MTIEELLIRGLELERAGDPDAAEEFYREADARGSIAGALLLGMLLGERGESAEAVKGLDRALKRIQGSIEDLSRGLQEDRIIIDSAFISRGETLATRHEYEFLQANPHIDLGLTLAENGDPEGAQVYLREELGQDQRSGAWWAVGRVLEVSGASEDAFAMYARASVQGDPKGAFRVGLSLLAANDWPGSRTALERSRDLGHEGAPALLKSMDELEAASLARSSEQSGESDPDTAKGWLL